MSFESAITLTGVYAIDEDTELCYNVTSLDLRMDLGGSVRATFTTSGLLDTERFDDLSSFVEDDPNKLSKFPEIKKGARVTLHVDFSQDEGNPYTSLLLAGRIKGINDNIKLSPKSLALGRGFILVSDLDFVDKMPAGSIHVLGLNERSFIPVNKSREYLSMQRIFSSLAEGTKPLNIPNLVASLIDCATPASGLEKSGIPTKLTGRINVEDAPVLALRSSNFALKKEIKEKIEKAYVTTPPLMLFNAIINSYFLVCAPRRLGTTDVIENNGWRKGKASLQLRTADVLGVSIYESTEGYPGFDAVAVAVTPHPGQGSGNESKTTTNYVFCAEVKHDGKPTIVAGNVISTSDGRGYELRINNKKIEKGTIQRFKLLTLPRWAEFRAVEDINTTEPTNSRLSQKDKIEWAKWLAFGTYASINRINNKAVLALKFMSYFDVADRLGEIVSFPVPGRAGDYYGRLTGVGLTLAISATGINVSTKAYLDCIRSEEDNNNLCIDFEIYRSKKNQ